MRTVAALLALTVASQLAAATKQTNPVDLREAVKIEQRIGSTLPLDATFKDESGKQVRLRDYFGNGKPVVITPVYYSCPMLCNVVIDNFINKLADLKLNVGDDFNVVTYSFDSHETPPEADAKRNLYLKRYGRPGAVEGWHFLTGDAKNVKVLSDALGFGFAWDEQRQQFAHAAAIMVVTPDGKIARYHYGMDWSPRDLRFSLVEASHNKLGTVTDHLLLICYQYEPGTGKYSARAMNVVRAGGVATIAALAGFIFVSLRRERASAKR
jgi:protein SCO1/2